MLTNTRQLVADEHVEKPDAADAGGQTHLAGGSGRDPADDTGLAAVRVLAHGGDYAVVQTRFDNNYDFPFIGEV